MPIDFLGEGQDSLTHFLEMDNQGQLNKIYTETDRFGRPVRIVKAEPEAQPEEAYSLEYTYSYPSSNEVTLLKRLILWTQELEDKLQNPINPAIEKIEVTTEKILDGLGVNQSVAFLSTVGGVSPFNWYIVDDPDNKFAIRNGNELYLDNTSANIADGSYEVEVMVVDSASPTNQTLNRIITFQIVTAEEEADQVFVVNSPTNPIPVEIIDDGAGGDLVNIYSEELGIASSVNQSVLTYTVPVGRILYLNGAEITSNNISQWEIIIDGNREARARLDHYSGFNKSLAFKLKIEENKVVIIKAIHNSPTVADFEARIMGNLA